jgi:hypothetical protein
VYANVEAELTKQLSASVAVRHENYSDFGSVTSGKLSGRFAVTPEFALRGAASNGFRAPSLAQQNYTISTTNLITINGTRNWSIPAPLALLLQRQKRWVRNRWKLKNRATIVWVRYCSRIKMSR